MSNIKTRITQMTILPEGESLFSELATTVGIVDEGAGEFVRVSQVIGMIQIAPEEWRPLCDAINKMIEQCRGDR